MDKPESAVFDIGRRVVYVSNVNGNYWAKDGNGFIAEIGLDGKILQKQWITGLDCPLGLALFRNNLYIADIDQVVVADVKIGKIISRHKAAGAIALNDIAADKNGDVYISDCKANRIYRLKNNKLDVWFDNAVLKGPNGLLCRHKDIILLNGGENKIYFVDKKSKAMAEYDSGIKNLDGVAADGNGGYFVSGAWQGEIYHFDSNGVKKLILDLGPEKIITADITYLPEEHILVVPTLKKSVIGYQWK